MLRLPISVMFVYTTASQTSLLRTNIRICVVLHRQTFPQKIRYSIAQITIASTVPGFNRQCTAPSQKRAAAGKSGGRANGSGSTSTQRRFKPFILDEPPFPAEWESNPPPFPAKWERDPPPFPTEWERDPSTFPAEWEVAQMRRDAPRARPDASVTGDGS
jgi:hypothetical protein